MTIEDRFARALADVGYVDPDLQARGVAVSDAETMLNALRFVAHDLRLCKSSDYWHAIAHDADDEDGYRTTLAANLLSAIADRKGPEAE